jgi:hypothetical protein
MLAAVRSVRPLRIHSRRPGPATLLAITRSARRWRTSQLPRNDSVRPLRLGARRRRVHLGRVDEVHAGSDSTIQLRMRIGFAVLLAPRHRAETDFGDDQVGAGQGGAFHRAALQAAGTVSRLQDGVSRAVLTGTPIA